MSKHKKKKKKKKHRKEPAEHPDMPCAQCDALCCKYVAIEIDKPSSKRDYDHIRWYLLHENVQVFMDHDKQWFIEFCTRCSGLDENNLCSFYDRRPRLCREHGEPPQICEYHDNPYALLFRTAEAFEKYLDKRQIKWRWKRFS
jgi:Fe-S-cluster containining protein